MHFLFLCFPYLCPFLFWVKTPHSALISPQSGSVLLEVSGLKSQKGQLCVEVYASADGFLSKPGSALMRRTVSVGTREVRFDGLPYGEYAVAVLHDENFNAVMDKNFLGIPKEGFGLTRNPKLGFGPPSFAETKIAVQAPSTRASIRIQYY